MSYKAGVIVMVTERETTNRPYAPVSNVISVLQRVRKRNLPESIDSEYLKDAGIPDGTVGRTLFAMQFLGLIGEDGIVAPAMKSIQTSTDEEYKAILAGLIREAYKEVFSVVDPGEETQDKILNVFRRYTPASQRERMVAFFLGICREAGIPTMDVPKMRTMVVAKVVRPSFKGQPAGQVRTKVERGAVPPQPHVSDVEPALEGLIRSLPKPGTALNAARRKQWLDMAEATLKFVYPETDAVATKEEEATGKTSESVLMEN
jgi:hypothetical protein